MKILPIDDLTKVLAIAAEDLGPDGTLDQIERYAEGVVAFIAELRYGVSKPIVIFAGPGGNGADALAAARLLADAGYSRLQVFLFNIKNRGFSDNCRRQRDRLLRQNKVNFVEVVGSMEPPELTTDHLVIDGLFGTGLRDKLPTGFSVLARIINESGATVISLDLPSGVHADWNPTLMPRDVVKANYTLACGAPHLAYFTPDAAPLCGKSSIVDIGLTPSAMREVATPYYLLAKEDIRRVLMPRSDYSTKDDFGSALLVAGTYGMVGAALLSAQGALRSGAGKVTVHSARCAMQILQTAAPEVMFRHDKNDIFVTDTGASGGYLRGFTAIGAGPGLGHREETVNAVEDLVKGYRGPLVLDADALNCISTRRTLLNHLVPGTIITPHIAEFDRLFGESATGEERFHKAVDLAAKHKIIIVLKQHHTAVIRPDGKVFFNSTGNPGMATPGSGDVLTGIITALLAQGYRPEISAAAGVFIHGLAGDMALKSSNTWSLSAGDIVAALPMAFATLI
ncbi:MAG: NAD(P)H-hydrate dehydratase [Muribaculaceae bacterium]|nr:NAD(P)H-hydrate dehydratase [Muribaculaceae bacterium]MCF0213981.1 NAD(P)H-hydrate dehydratase [Muribaculaceae bacterium]